MPVEGPAAAPAAEPAAPAPGSEVPAAAQAAAVPAEPAAPAAAPSVPAADAAQVAELLKAAHALYDRKQRKPAYAAYEQVLAVQPNNPEALSKLGYLELQAGDDARAKQFASQAVAIDPTSSEGWIVLGAALESLRDRTGAREAYAKCAELGTGPYASECKRLAR
jgi:Flp pilus assembly protein TadD